MRSVLQAIGIVTCGALLALGGALADRALFRKAPAPAQTLVDWPQPCPQECGGGSDLFQLRRK